jgi:hypothetical protein
VTWTIEAMSISNALKKRDDELLGDSSPAGDPLSESEMSGDDDTSLIPSSNLDFDITERMEMVSSSSSIIIVQFPW